MQLLTRQQTADLLGLRPQTLARWAMTGAHLRFVKLGDRSVRYIREDVERFVERRTFGGNSSK